MALRIGSLKGGMNSAPASLEKAERIRRQIEETENGILTVVPVHEIKTAVSKPVPIEHSTLKVREVLDKDVLTGLLGETPVIDWFAHLYRNSSKNNLIAIIGDMDEDDLLWLYKAVVSERTIEPEESVHGFIDSVSFSSWLRSVTSSRLRALREIESQKTRS